MDEYYLRKPLPAVPENCTATDTLYDDDESFLVIGEIAASGDPPSFEAVGAKNTNDNAAAVDNATKTPMYRITRLRLSPPEIRDAS